MTWKTDLKLTDLEAATAIEIECKRCGLSRYETPVQIMEQFDCQHAYLDEVECNLCCSNRFCRGEVRISLIHDDKNEGFVGGMA